LARASSAFVTSSVVSGGAHELPQLPPHPNFAFHSPPPPRLLRGEHELHDSLDLRLRRTEGEPSDDDGARGRSSLDPRRPRAGEMPSALRRPGDTPGETPGERPPPPLPKLPPPPPPVPLAAAAAACRPPQKLTERGSSPPRSAEAAEEDLCQGTVAGKRQEGKRQEGRRVGGQAGRRAGWRGGEVARWRGGGAAGRRRLGDTLSGQGDAYLRLSAERQLITNGADCGTSHCAGLGLGLAPTLPTLGAVACRVRPRGGSGPAPRLGWDWAPRHLPIQSEPRSLSERGRHTAAEVSAEVQPGCEAAEVQPPQEASSCSSCSSCSSSRGAGRSASAAAVRGRKAAFLAASVACETVGR
jgi:hypothetical protein